MERAPQGQPAASLGDMQASIPEPALGDMQASIPEPALGVMQASIPEPVLGTLDYSSPDVAQDGRTTQREQTATRSAMSEDEAVIEELVVGPHVNVQERQSFFRTPENLSTASRRNSQAQSPRWQTAPRRVADVVPPIVDTDRPAGTLDQREREKGAQEARQSMLRDMDALLSAKLADILAARPASSAAQTAPAAATTPTAPTAPASQPQARETGHQPSFTRRDRIIDVDTLLQRDRTSHHYVLPRTKPRQPVVIAELSDDEEGEDPPIPAARRQTPLVMAAAEHHSRQGRWTTPKDVPQLTEDVDDIDWWFHLMQIHLNKCRITDRQERIDCLHTHTEDAFHQRIWQRCDAEAVDRSLMYRDPDTYRVFVADRFSKVTALQQLQRRLDAMAGKSLSPTKAWDEVYRLSFCYNEKAKRKGRPILTQEDITRHFISALPTRIKEYMRSMMLHDHPMVHDASHALTAASRYLEEQALEAASRGQRISVNEEEEDEQPAMLAARGKGERKRGRQNDTSGRRNKRQDVNGSKKEQGRRDATPTFAALPSATARNEETRICYRCKQRGHLRKDCPLRFQDSDQVEGREAGRHIAYQQRDTQQREREQRERERERPVCSECGRVGHTAEQCWIAHPHLRPQGNRKRIAGRGRPTALTAANAVPRTQTRNGVVALAAPSRMAEQRQGPTTDTSWLHPAENAETGGAAYLALVAATSHQHSPRPAPKASTLLALSALMATPTTPVTSQPVVPNPCRCLLFLHTLYRGRTLRLVIDTGASVNLVNAAVLDHAHSRHPVEPFEIKGVNDQRQTLNTQVEMTMELSGYPYAFSLYVAANLPICAILGLDAIIEAGWLVDAIHRQLLHVHHALPPLKLAPCTHTVLLVRTSSEVTIPARSWKHVTVAQPYQRPDIPHYVCVCLTPSLPPTKALHGAPVVTDWAIHNVPIPICNTSDEDILIPADTAISYAECTVLLAQDSIRHPDEDDRKTECDDKGNGATATTAKQKKGDKNIRLDDYFDLAQARANWSTKDVGSLRRLLQHYDTIWKAPGVIGKAIGGEHRIETGDHLPVALPVRRIAWAERDRINEEVAKMKRQKVIVDSDSPWSSPPVLVRKKDGSVRFCIDYRKLNEITVADKYPLPRIDDVLDELNRGVFFSVIDLKSGYWQIPMRETDAPKTAFQTVDGHYHFTVMPFGLRNAPATFQRMMDVVFSGMKWKGLMVYMDDIVVYSATAGEHLSLLEGVFQRLSKAGLKINPAKTTLVSREVAYLGHIISAGGVRPNPKKVWAVQNLRAPSSAKEVRTFLGLTGYYRRFIPAYAAMAEPLFALTRAGTLFRWGEREQTAFDLLKTHLCEAPTLAYPPPGQTKHCRLRCQRRCCRRSSDAGHSGRRRSGSPIRQLHLQWGGNAMANHGEGGIRRRLGSKHFSSVSARHTRPHPH